jgi:hypothetical protein
MERILQVDVTLNVTRRSEIGLSNVTLALACHVGTSPSLLDHHPERHPHFLTITRNVTLPDQALVLPHRPQPSRSAFRGAGSVGDPGGRLVPRLTFRLPLLALAALAPLTASSGVGSWRPSD